nr:LysR family transcriptional regulator [Litorihabitans aurantiacus]
MGSLRLLQAVAEHGSLTGAAHAIGISQPAASQHVRRLERRVGTALVERAGRAVRLTPAGAALARHGDTIGATLRAALLEVEALAGIRAGVVRLATFPSSTATLVPRALAMLRQDHPGLTVRLVEAEPPESLALLRSGECDVVLAFSYAGLDDDAGALADGAADAADDAPGLVRTPLIDDVATVVLAHDHPLAGQSRLHLSDLAQEEWIAGCPRCRDHLLRAARAAAFSPDVSFATDDYSAVLGLVAAGLGVALVPGLVRPVAERHPGVAVRDVTGVSVRRVHAATSADLMRVPAVAATVAALREAAAEFRRPLG